MLRYLLKRILAMFPTLVGITLVCFVVINLAPGGPVESKLRELKFAGAGGGSGNSISQEMIEALNKQYGLDKPLHVRYWIWLKNIATLEFGESFKDEEPVLDVIASKLPVSLQFGVLAFVLSYLVCIPLGVAKAVRVGQWFDSVTSFVILVMYAIPPLMLGILLMIFFAGGGFLDWFPLQGVVSDHYDSLGFWAKVVDRVHHFVLPTLCYMVGSFTVLTLLMRNSLLDEIASDYVRTARAKGLGERMVVYKHALRNALIPIVTGMGGFLSLFFAGSIIIEQLFGLDGVGLLSFQAALSRDYNVLMALIFLTSLLHLVGRLISDFLYVLVDPRIDFEKEST